jgi:hypothetical protein
MSYYVWTGKNVRRIPEVHSAIDGAYIYDPDDTPEMRWGQMVHGRWAELRKEDMPKEFLTHLLLLGISS